METEQSRTPAPTTVTGASQWRRGQLGELYTLPGCGYVARLIRPSLTALAASVGGIANPLSNELLTLAAGRRPADDAQVLAFYQKNCRAYLEAAALCFIEPRLVLDREPKEGEIGPGDLTDYDYTWLYYTFIQGDAEALAPFRVARESALA